MMTFFTVLTGTPRRSATAPAARLWSRRVRQEMLARGMRGACAARMAALVLAGLATTRTLTPGAAWSWRAAAWEA